MPNPLSSPTTNPTPIFEFFRGAYATELLTAAVAHFSVFKILAEQPQTLDELASQLNLASRPANVLITALKAMQLLEQDDQQRLQLTPLALEHLVPGNPFDVSGYVGLAAEAPGVLEMVRRLRTNQPAGAEAPAHPSTPAKGTAFIYREGVESAMEQTDSARGLTLSLAGRARNVAPKLAEVADLASAHCLLDVGGGSGIYAIACLLQQPNLRAQVWDRPEVLRVAAEFAQQYGVADRLECLPGDMFSDEIPRGADRILLSNVLHDWDIPECRQLIDRCAAALPSSGQLWIHDVFLNDDLSGPLPIALYSAGLFTLTEGRAYSAGEYRQWLLDANLQPLPVLPTLVHCGLLPAIKP